MKAAYFQRSAAGSGDDGQRRIHEHHLEQEHHHHGDVISSLVHQEQAVLAPQAEGLSEQGEAVFAAEHRRAAQGAQRSHAAHLNGEADQPVGQQTGAIDHEVHHHGVVGVLGPAQARFDRREPGLHEHDQEAGDQGPHEVDGDPVLADLVQSVLDGDALLAVGYHDVGHVTGERPVRIALGAGVGTRGGRVLDVLVRDHYRSRRGRRSGSRCRRCFRRRSRSRGRLGPCE